MNKLLLLSSSLLLFFLFMSPAKVTGQGNQTLFDSNIHTGGFAQLTYGLTFVNGEATPVRGFRLAISFRLQPAHTLNLGYGSYRTPSSFEAVNLNNADVGVPDMRTDYSGLELEYLNQTHRILHFGVQTLLGTGEVRYRDPGNIEGPTSSDYFVIQPGVNMHLNVTHWFRVSGGIFYRFAIDTDLPGTSDDDLSGFSALLGLRLGWF